MSKLNKEIARIEKVRDAILASNDFDMSVYEKCILGFTHKVAKTRNTKDYFYLINYFGIREDTALNLVYGYFCGINPRTDVCGINTRTAAGLCGRSKIKLVSVIAILNYIIRQKKAGKEI